MTAAKLSKIQNIFKILSDETRLSIVVLLLDKKELSCGEISQNFGHLTQPTLSHHFKTLENAGIIEVEKVGTSHIYTLDKNLLAESGIDINLLKNLK